MLLKTIRFDKHNQNWSKNQNVNHEFLLSTERFINGLIRNYGYIYLNQICELIGDPWNPEDENPYVKNDGIDRLAFVQFAIFDEPDNSILMHIYCYD